MKDAIGIGALGAAIAALLIFCAYKAISLEVAERRKEREELIHTINELREKQMTPEQRNILPPEIRAQADQGRAEVEEAVDTFMVLWREDRADFLKQGITDETELLATLQAIIFHKNINPLSMSALLAVALSRLEKATRDDTTDEEVDALEAMLRDSND